MWRQREAPKRPTDGEGEGPTCLILLCLWMLSRKAAGPLVRRLLSSSRALPSSQPSIPLVAAEVDAATHHVSLRWSDGLRRSFHPLWLADNCLSRRHPGTRQKLKTAADLPTSLRIAAAEASDGVLQVRWDEPYQGQTTSALTKHGIAFHVLLLHHEHHPLAILHILRKLVASAWD